MCAIALLASVAAILAYARVVGFGFVYDDAWSIQRNAHLASPLGELIASSLGGRAAAAGIPDATRPTMIASIWLDHMLFGLRAGGYHAHSLLLHALDAALSSCAAFALTRRRTVAVVAGVWTAVAPLQAEAVASVNYREDLLVAAGVLALTAWLFWPSPGVPRRGTVYGIVAIWVLALFAKESAVAFALIVPAIAATGHGRRSVVARQRELALLAAVLVLWLNWRLGVHVLGDDVPVARHAAFGTRLLDTARSELEALGRALFPFTSTPEYPRLAHASPVWLLALAGLCAGVVLALRRRRLRPAAIGVAIALLAPLATSPLVGPINARADRYLYLSVFGAGLVWGALVQRLLSPQRALLAVGGIAAVFVPLAWHAAAPWASDRLLWRRAAETAPDSPRAWAALSRLARLRGDDAEARRFAARAIQADPDYVPAHVTALYNALARGDPDAARAELVAIQRLHGGTLPAVVRARQCASLPPPQARRCIGAAR